MKSCSCSSLSWTARVGEEGGGEVWAMIAVSRSWQQWHREKQEERRVDCVADTIGTQSTSIESLDSLFR